jgi:hypothetical protein
MESRGAVGNHDAVRLHPFTPETVWSNRQRIIRLLFIYPTLASARVACASTRQRSLGRCPDDPARMLRHVMDISCLASLPEEIYDQSEHTSVNQWQQALWLDPTNNTSNDVLPFTKEEDT